MRRAGGAERSIELIGSELTVWQAVSRIFFSPLVVSKRPRTGLELVLNWFRTGLELVSNWSRTDLELVSN